MAETKTLERRLPSGRAIRAPVIRAIYQQTKVYDQALKDLEKVEEDLEAAGATLDSKRGPVVVKEET